MPMTPQKINFHLPIVETPNTSALIKSIVQSAKKTGLNSSPVRVPFALSPMAFKFMETKLNFSPIKAKEPSQVIKEAFLNHVEQSDEDISLPFDNKRPHEELECEEQEDGLEEEQEELHANKRERLEQAEQTEQEEQEEQEQEDIYHDNKDESEHKQGELDMNEYINNSYEMESETNHHSYTDITNITDSLSSLDSLPSLNSSSAPLFPSALASTSAFPSTNFSTDLLRNLKDPEFASPELSSGPDCRVSRSAGQDKYAVESISMVNRSLSKSSSSGSSTKNHHLLPSGIVKLLEKKRQEKEQHQQSTSSFSSATATGKEGKKKFDLKESLKRPLNYKPHIGSIPKKD